MLHGIGLGARKTLNKYLLNKWPYAFKKDNSIKIFQMLKGQLIFRIHMKG